MTLKRLGAVVFLFIAFSISAATLQIPSLKVGPVTYKKVIVIGANATDIYFTHEQGIGNAKLKYLGAELQKRFDYDPKAAAEAERRQAEADVLYQTMVTSNMAVQAKALAARATPTSLPEALADPISDKSLLGKTAPALELDNWVGDQPSIEGKSVLLSFWAPWSAASRQCIPELNAFQKKFADKLVVIGVTPVTANDEDQSAGPKLEFATATDAKAKVCVAAGINSIPAVLLIDQKGIVRYEGHPAGLTEKKLQAFLAQTAE